LSAVRLAEQATDSCPPQADIAENRNSGAVAHVSESLLVVGRDPVRREPLGREPENYSKTLSHRGEIRG
jgi:hypothetical protein